MLRIKRIEKITDVNVPFEIFLNDIKLGEIKNWDTNLYDLKDGDFNVYIKCGEMISEKVSFSYDSHSTIEMECFPKYSESKISRFIYKYLMGNKGISLIKVKDFYV